MYSCRNVTGSLPLEVYVATPRYTATTLSQAVAEEVGCASEDEVELVH
jgi:hypothetical protein